MESTDWDGTKIPPLTEVEHLRLFGKKGKKLRSVAEAKKTGDAKTSTTVQGTLSKKTAQELKAQAKDTPLENLPVNDARALARERGLLGTTLVIVTGEFGGAAAPASRSTHRVS